MGWVTRSPGCDAAEGEYGQQMKQISGFHEQSLPLNAHIKAAQAHLSRAGSIMSGRLEAAIRYTLLRSSVPSISVRSEFTTLQRRAF